MRTVSKLVLTGLFLLFITTMGSTAEEFFPEKSNTPVSDQESILTEWVSILQNQWQQPIVQPNTAAAADEFNFDDGTLQGWLLAGVWDEALNGPLVHNLTAAWDDDTNYPGAYQTDPADLNGCMALNVTNLSVTNSHGKTFWGAFLTSPDLSGNQDWIDSEGIVLSSLDAFDFVNGHPRSASLAILVRDTDTGIDHLLALAPSFHPHYTNPALAATNGWAQLPIPWAAFAGLPTNYVVKYISIIILGEMSQSISGQFCLDDIAPIAPQIAKTFFDFDDATTQGWTADGPYDPSGTSLTSNFTNSWVDDTNHPNAVGTDPTGDDNGAFALTSSSGPNVSNPSSASFWIVKLTSPDLSTNTAWQNADGFSVFATDGFTYRSGSPRYVNFYVQVYDHDQARDRYFYSGTAQIIQHSSSGGLAGTNGWEDFSFNWAGGSFPPHATIKKVMVYVWGHFGSSFTGDFCIDKVQPLGGPILSVSPVELDFGITQTQLSFAISNIGNNDLTWNITSDVTKTWLTSISPTSGVNAATIEVQVDRESMAGLTDQTDLTVTSNGGTATVAVQIQKTAAVLPDNWAFTGNTGSNATIVLPTAANPTIDGESMHNGDYAGIFTAGGLCCGYAMWEGDNLAITAWGDDSQTTEIDGLVPDERIFYRAFSPAMGGTEAGHVTIAYSIGDGNYNANDYMVLRQFDAQTSEILPFDFPMGWGGFSMNVLPPDPDPEVVFQHVLSHLEIMKDGLGHSFIPEFGINNLGDIDPKKGYQMYWTSPVTFDV
ncbi:BACON domain-containing protein, partial [bacterium]|nr:BACON domain-containing protein [bacterium]